MSSVGRAASRGSKGGKGEHAAASAKPQKSDTKTDVAKTVENPKAQVSISPLLLCLAFLCSSCTQVSYNLSYPQPTPEQMRIAQIIDGKSEDPTLKDKIKQVRFIFITLLVCLSAALTCCIVALF